MDFAVHSYKLRLSPHYLTVETGRYNNIPFERRLCFLWTCQRHSVRVDSQCVYASMRYFDKFWWIFLLLILLSIKKMGSDMSFKNGLSNHLGIYLFGSQCDSSTGHIRTSNWIMEVNFQLLFNIGAVYRVYVLYLHVNEYFRL